MTDFTCKMCGGRLKIAIGATVTECEYCGTPQTLPKFNDEKRLNQFARANHFLRNREYDKAMGIYETILNEDDTDAEAYWALVLCRYGIEYVDDPGSHRRIPTVNRVQYTSVFDDDNYKSALKYADDLQRQIYEDEAKVINNIQKKFLTISENEDPFDVFISFKDKDENGKRTHDSVLAQDLYYQLTQEGFKVFFSRITLEDKLGEAYEPYIFAALNSAKVMVVVGSKPEYFNAVWVKNEWSRFLSLMKQGQKKHLIPAYKDMDPYDLPDEFSCLQAQDMTKLGFMQDLLRGIRKLTGADEPKPTPVMKETVIIQGNSGVGGADAIGPIATNSAPLLKRAFLFLEDGNWNDARAYCEKVLDIDPECAMAYVGKLMAELGVKKQDDLKNCKEPFDNRDNFKKAIRFADAELQSKLAGFISFIVSRNQMEFCEGVYQSAKSTLDSESTSEALLYAANMLEEIRDYKDAVVLAKNCREKAKVVSEQEKKYANAIELFKKNTVEAHVEAIAEFKALGGFKDSNEYFTKTKDILLNTAKERFAEPLIDIERLTFISDMLSEIHGWKDAAELSTAVGKCLDEKKIKRAKSIALTYSYVIPEDTWINVSSRRVVVGKDAWKSVVSDLLDGVIGAPTIDELEKYRKTSNREAKIGCTVFSIIVLAVIAAIGFAIYWFAVKVPNDKYNKAVELMEDGNYADAILMFEKVEKRKDSKEKIKECYIAIYGETAGTLIAELKPGDIFTFGKYEQDNNLENGPEDIDWIVIGKDGSRILIISKSVLANKPFDEGYSNWADSQIRAWLNEDFYNAAFSEDEKTSIALAEIFEQEGTKQRTSGGDQVTVKNATTRDKVFLLSLTEWQERKKSINWDCVPTAAAKDRYNDSLYGNMDLDRDGYCDWWLRSQTAENLFYYNVGDGQAIEDYDCESYFSTRNPLRGIRPVIWVDLSADTDSNS